MLLSWAIQCLNMSCTHTYVSTQRQCKKFKYLRWTKGEMMVMVNQKVSEKARMRRFGLTVEKQRSVHSYCKAFCSTPVLYDSKPGERK